MNNQRSVEAVIAPPPPHMVGDGFRVHNFFPGTKEIGKNKMGRYTLPDEKGFVEVIAGEYSGIKGPATTFTPIHAYNARLKKDAKLELNFPKDYNTGLLIIEGNVKVNGINAHADHFVLLKNDGEDFSIEATQDSIILILSGEPINEPVVAYGPFVMNTWEEIEQAVNDVNEGKFGVLAD